MGVEVLPHFEDFNFWASEPRQYFLHRLGLNLLLHGADAERDGILVIHWFIWLLLGVIFVISFVSRGLLKAGRLDFAFHRLFEYITKIKDYGST